MNTINFKFPRTIDSETSSCTNSKIERVKKEFLFLCDIIAKDITEEAEAETGIYKDFNQVIYTELGLLYLSPTKAPEAPIIDEITRKLTWLWRQKVETGLNSFGSYTCKCGAISDTADYLLVNPDGKFILTNSLCIHYISSHRSEIILQDWIKVISLLYPVQIQDNPSKQELYLE
jgi:hypothetical protein